MCCVYNDIRYDHRLVALPNGNCILYSGVTLLMTSF